MFVQQCTTKQESAAEYSEYAVAREEVVCDFIGELLSEQKTLETFCESIKSGEIKAETARGIVAAWRKITGILRGKGVKQTDTATAALVQRVQEQFGTDIETAENAVRKMQKALSAAMRVETQNKNAAVNNSYQKSNSDIRRSAKDDAQNADEYKKPITQQDVIPLRSIGRKSVNEFSSEDIQKTKKWAYKFYQELGVKSPFFRAWFGDWRANDTKTKVKFVTVNAESIERSDVPRGTFFNKDTQWSIKSNSDGVGETANKSGKWSDGYHTLSDIDKMLENAVLLDTVAVNSPSKRLGENAAFIHHLYCPIYVNGEAGLAKIYVAETFGNDHKFYLLKIEKASSDMGFNYVSEVLTPDSEAASEDAEVSVADIFSFVKNHDGNYEANSAYPVHFLPRKANPLFLNEDGTPKVFYHGSKKNGGFTVFRDWQYFTEQKRYAERYAERGNKKSLYEVYLTADKVFDTRDEDAAKIFESIRQEYGLGELQDTGLPDWTDGYDITEYLSEHPELGYDAVLLDEGGDLVNGEPVSRGLSIVIRDSSQVKSATDNIGTFDRSNRDIRYSKKDKPAVSAYTERYGTEIETQAQEDRAKAQNKNAAETGDVMFSKKNNTKRSATSPLSGSPATQGSIGMASKSVTAAAEHLGIKVNLSQVSDYVKSAIAVFSDVLDAISNNTPVRGSKHNISAGNIVGILIGTTMWRIAASTASRASGCWTRPASR